MKEKFRGRIIIDAMDQLPWPIAILVCVLFSWLMWYDPGNKDLYIPVIVVGITSICFKLGLVTKKGELWKWFKFKKGAKTPRIMNIEVEEGQMYVITTSDLPEEDLKTSVKKGGVLIWTTFTGQKIIGGDIEKVSRIIKNKKGE